MAISFILNVSIVCLQFFLLYLIFKVKKFTEVIIKENSEIRTRLMNLEKSKTIVVSDDWDEPTTHFEAPSFSKMPFKVRAEWQWQAFVRLVKRWPELIELIKKWYKKCLNIT